jgi:uncharacterized protein YabE (DUF348 family)
LFHSFKAAFKSGGVIAVAMVICLTLMVGLVACGGDKTTETTVGVTTTAAEQTVATVADTVTSEAFDHRPGAGRQVDKRPDR